MTHKTNEDEYDEIVNFIDINMTEYNDGSLSIPEIVEDLYKRFTELVSRDSEKFALLMEVAEEIRDYGKLPLSGNLKNKILEFEARQKTGFNIGA